MAAERPAIDLLGRQGIVERPETREIVFGAGDRRHLLEGWSIDERSRSEQLTFVWANALEASLSFEIVQIVDQQVLVKVRSLPTQPPQHVTVAVNGHEIAAIDPVPIFLEYRFVIPAENLVRGKNRMTFRHAALAVPPRERSGSRLLAAAYSWIGMGPQCLPLRGFGPPGRPGIARPPRKRSGPFVAVGPIELVRRLDVPRDAVLRYEISLPAGADARALTAVTVRDTQGTHDLGGAMLAPRWFGRGGRRSIEADLSHWSGQRVEVAIQIVPEICRTSVATAAVERAAIYARNDAGSS